MHNKRKEKQTDRQTGRQADRQADTEGTRHIRRDRQIILNAQSTMTVILKGQTHRQRETTRQCNNRSGQPFSAASQVAASGAVAVGVRYSDWI